jgi:hypothetical protein
LTIHDTTSCIAYIPTLSGDSGLEIYNIYAYNYNGGVNLAGSNSNNILSGANIHDSIWGSSANWDATGCPYHHDGIHAWGILGGEIHGVNYYNNVVQGDFGGCATGAVFFEGYNEGVNLYNNAFLISYTQEGNGIVNLNGFNVGFYNNTILGNLQTGDICFNIGYSSDSSHVYTPSISFENNIVENCRALIELQNSPTLTAWDYNGYGKLTSGATLVYNGTWYYTLSSWQAAKGKDLNSVIPSSGITGSLGLTATGFPQTGSPVIGAGVNLTSLGISELNKSGSAGGTQKPNARSSTGAWTIGVYNLLNAPNNLRVVSN